ncbi:hypothetical protein LINPERPRIM_LOCUS5695 [Linum perenne]
MTKTTSGTKYCTVHLFLGELTRLYNHLRKASSGYDLHFTGVAWNMKSKVEMYGALRGQQLKLLMKEELVKMFDMYRDSLLAREGEQVQGLAAPPMNIEEDEDYDDTFARYD